jgi:hypothetical protein
MPSTDLPEFREWSIAAVRLLQGVVYADEGPAWGLVLSSGPQLAGYFARLGLLLVVDEAEGMAYLRQMEPDEMPEGYDRLPRVFRRTRLGYDETLLCVLLRQELLRFEEDDLHNERCVVEASSLFEQWRTLSAEQYDEVRARRELAAALARLEELGFVRKFAAQPEAWEVRPVLKARLPAAALERLKAELQAAARQDAGAQTDDAGGENRA